MPASPLRPKLRKREIALAVGIGALAAFGAGTILSIDDGSGPPAAVAAVPQTYNLTDFDEITTTGPQDVFVTLGDSFSVRSEGAPQALGQLDVLVEDGKLVIRPGRSFRGNWGGLSSATYHVTMPRLDAVALAGSGGMHIDRIDSPSFTGTVAGSGDLSIDALKVDEVDFRLNGSGSVAAAGTAREARISVGGSGEVEAGGLQSETASVSVGGSGSAALTVIDEARVSVMGSGDVDITGPARCNVSRMGSGDVSCSGGTD